MPWVPNPVYWMVGEWLLRAGVPFVAARLAKAPPPAERVLFEGEARLEHGPEKIGGLLSVTPSTLVFTPSAIRTRGTAHAIPLVDIESIEATRGRLFGLIPLWRSGLKIRTRRGIFRFRVDHTDRSAWLRELRTAWAMVQPAGPVPGGDG